MFQLVKSSDVMNSLESNHFLISFDDFPQRGLADYACSWGAFISIFEQNARTLLTTAAKIPLR
jgi:hypothetical protein